MKSYPSIPYHNDRLFGQDIIAFDKLDGNNIRASWNAKSGWYKFGSRTQLIDRGTPILGQSIDIFFDKYANALENVFRTKYPKAINFVVFCELWGENSFSGRHKDGDILDLTLIDVSQYKRGFIPTIEFIDNFSAIGIPQIIYEGKLTQDFINKVKRNDYNLSEGVVVRGINDNFIFKIKTNEWLQKVKNIYG